MLAVCLPRKSAFKVWSFTWVEHRFLTNTQLAQARGRLNIVDAKRIYKVKKFPAPVGHTDKNCISAGFYEKYMTSKDFILKIRFKFYE